MELLMTNAMKQPEGSNTVPGLSDDPNAVHLFKVLTQSGERLIVSMPIEQMEGFKRVVVRGSAMLDEHSAEIVSLVDRLQYGHELKAFSPRENF
jgi:hypothetical protein